MGKIKEKVGNIKDHESDYFHVKKDYLKYLISKVFASLVLIFLIYMLAYNLDVLEYNLYKIGIIIIILLLITTTIFWIADPYRDEEENKEGE